MTSDRRTAGEDLLRDRHHREAIEAAHSHRWAVLREHPGATTCPTCSAEWGPMARRSPPACECELAVAREELARLVEAHRAAFVEELWAEAHLPDRYATKTFDDFVPRRGTEAALRLCRAYAESFDAETGTGVWLAGPYGSGKTHLVVATARAVLERRLARPLFASAATLIASVLPQAGRGEWDWSVVEAATAADLLIMDDIGQEHPSSFGRGVLMRLIDARYQDGRPTLFTSNGGDEQLADRLGGAAVSRLFEMAPPVVLKATDYRRELARGRTGGSR